MPDRKLAIIGASGFVGSSLCERLFFEGRRDFTAFINTSGSAARLARLCLPMQELNLLNRERVMQALAGYSAVVNCSRSDNHQQMLLGLRNLLHAVRHIRIEKLIHISSVAIYGADPPIESSTEACPPCPGNDQYGVMKVKQDQAVMALQRAGVAAYILCPPNISGPHSPFIHGLGTRLAQGPIPLVDDGCHPCNLVHVDNLVEAILTAERSNRMPTGRYYVNESPRVSWRRFFEDLSQSMGIRCRFLPVSRNEVLSQMTPPEESSGLSEHVRIALSGEFRRGLMLMPTFRRLNDVATATFENLPSSLQTAMRHRFERRLMIPQDRLGPALDDQYVRVQVRVPYHSPDRLMRELGYRPVLSYERGLETMADWLRFAAVA